MKKIKLSNGAESMIDDEDYERLSQYKWSYSNGYATRGKLKSDNAKWGTTIPMGRFILDPPYGLIVDHINGNRLDNQKSNLRICTYRQNSQNRKKPKNNITGFKGVSPSWHCYGAQITNLGKVYFLGYYKTAREAANAYDLKAIELFGEFARLNNPDIMKSQKIIRDPNMKNIYRIISPFESGFHSRIVEADNEDLAMKTEGLYDTHIRYSVVYITSNAAIISVVRHDQKIEVNIVNGDTK